MHTDQQRRRVSARRDMRPAYFVGRRQGEAAEVYTVSAQDVRRLQSAGRFGDSTLDWRGSSSARMELADLVISRIAEQRPSHQLKARFALYVLSTLPEEGFVLHTDQIWRWLLAAGDERDFRAPDSPVRSWAGRLRSLLSAVPTFGSHA